MIGEQGLLSHTTVDKRFTQTQRDVRGFFSFLGVHVALLCEMQIPEQYPCWFPILSLSLPRCVSRALEKCVCLGERSEREKICSGRRKKEKKGGSSNAAERFGYRGRGEEWGRKRKERKKEAFLSMVPTPSPNSRDGGTAEQQEEEGVHPP